MMLDSPAPAQPAPVMVPQPSNYCERCGATATAQWRRRLTDTELAAELAQEQARRDERLLLADAQLPPPDFGPLPTAEDFVRAVFSCGDHAISLEHASQIHQADCTGPHGDHDPHPQCTCEREPLPQPDPDPEPVAPAHWTT